MKIFCLVVKELGFCKNEHYLTGKEYMMGQYKTLERCNQDVHILDQFIKKININTQYELCIEEREIAE